MILVFSFQVVKVNGQKRLTIMKKNVGNILDLYSLLPAG